MRLGLWLISKPPIRREGGCLDPEITPRFSKPPIRREGVQKVAATSAAISKPPIRREGHGGTP